MKHRFLPLLLAVALIALPACTKKVVREAPPAATVAAGQGPQIATGPVAPPPTIADPAANETLYIVHILDRASERPIGGAFVRLMRGRPTDLFMREPMRRDVISEYPTPMHGQVHFTAEADGKMKYILINGRGFAPFITDAGEAVAGKRRELTLKMDIVPSAKFIVYLPDGDRADNAVVTMKLASQTAAPIEGDGGKLSGRPTGSANYGTTERCDDLGEVLFNRNPGEYWIEAMASTGRNRFYKKIDWTGSWSEPMVIHLPEKSMAKPY